MRRLALLVGGLFGVAFLLAAPALAHTTLLGSDPADGARLPAAPRSVTLTFDEGVGLDDLGYLHVTDEHGRLVDAGPAYHPHREASKVADDLKPGLGDGSYTASFRVVSADSHPVTGSIAFVVGTGPLIRNGVGGGGGAVDPVTGDAFVVARWISYAGLVLLGGGWLSLTVWPAGRDERRARRIVWVGLSALGAGAVLELLLQGPYAADAGLSKITAGSVLDDTLHTDYGQLHSLRLMLLGVLAVVLARALQPDVRRSRLDATAGALGVAVVWTFSQAGHGATTAPSWLSVPIDMLHALAVTVWLGGLVMLAGAVFPRREPDELRAVLPLFSRVAFWAVALLVASGTYSAFRGIGTVNAIFKTTYGLLVIGKIVLLCGVLVVANLSRRLVHGPMVAYAMTDAVLAAGPDLTDDEIATERLRRSVVVEAVVGLVVLALTAVLVAEPRGKEALPASHRAPISASALLTGGRHLEITAPSRPTRRSDCTERSR